MNSWFLHPLEELNHLRGYVDETFKNWTGGLTHQASAPLDWGWKPRMDVCESLNSYKIILELPGFQKEDLDVQVNGRFLSIKGSKQECKSDEWRYHRRERYSGGEFHRAVALPNGIDGTSIQAKFQGGVLTLVVPKTGGKSSQHISLLGREEHASRRGVIDAEERERRRRMEENDPMLSRNHWVAARMGTVIDEERERYRRMHEFDEVYTRQSRENRRMTVQLESNERLRRIHDHRGEAEKKKNAMRVSRMIKSGGISTRSHTFGKSSSGNRISILEEQERRERIRDTNRQRLAMANAKRVSMMIKQGGSKVHLNSNPWKKVNHSSSSFSKKMPTSSYTSLASFNNKKNHGHHHHNSSTMNGGSFSNNMSMMSNNKNKFLNNLEEKERERRLKDKRGQMEAKKNASMIAHMIGGAHF